MSLTAKTVIHAIGVLRPAGGTPRKPPSSENLAEWTPAPGTLEAALAALRGAGFEAAPSGPNSVSFAAPVKHFEEFFAVKLRENEKGGIVCESGGSDLPLARVPAELRAALHGAGFEEPPDFGPVSFG